MSEDKKKEVSLQRGGPKPAKRRVPWGWIAGGVLIVALLAGGLWLFWPRISASLRPAPTLPPAAEAQSPGGVLFYSNFDNESDFAQWSLFDNGSVAAVAVQGAILFRVDAPEDTAAWSSLDVSFNDFNLVVSATKVDGADDNGISVIFRENGPENFNRFDIGADGYYTVSMVRNGVPMIVSDWRYSEIINRGLTTNQMRVIARGSEFRFEVNGQALPLCISSDPAVSALWDPFAETPTCLGGVVQDFWINEDLPAGRIGLGAQGFVGFDGTNTTPAFTIVSFDELLITAP